MKRSVDYRRHKDKEILTNLYVEQSLSVREIAKVFGCGTTTVFYWLRKHNIPMRAWNLGDHLRGKTLTEEQKKNISECNKKRFANKEDHPFYQRHHSEESKKKISESMKEHYRKKQNG